METEIKTGRLAWLMKTPTQSGCCFKNAIAFGCEQWAYNEFWNKREVIIVTFWKDNSKQQLLKVDTLRGESTSEMGRDHNN